MKKSEQYTIILVTGVIVFSLILIYLNPGNPINFNKSDHPSYPVKAFSKGNITFDYPEGWQDYTENANTQSATETDTKTNKTYSTTYHTNEFLAFVGDPTTVGFENMTLPTTSLVVTKTEYTTNTGNFAHPEGFMSKMLIQDGIRNIETVKSYHVYKNREVIKREFAISGLKAYEFIFIGFHTGANNWEYTRMIAFEKRDVSKKKETFYTIMCTSMDSNIGKSKVMFDRIIDSFKVQ